MSSSSSFHPSLLLSLHLFIHSLWSFIIVSVLSSSVCCSSYMMSTSCRPLLVLFIELEQKHKKKSTISPTGALTPGEAEVEVKSQSSDHVIRMTEHWTDSGGIKPKHPAPWLWYVSQCEFVCVTVSACIRWRWAELQTSLSVKIKVKNTSTIKTGCSYLMSWKPWEPSLGGFVVVRQFQWQVLVPT